LSAVTTVKLLSSDIALYHNLCCWLLLLLLPPLLPASLRLQRRTKCGSLCVIHRSSIEYNCTVRQEKRNHFSSMNKYVNTQWWIAVTFPSGVWGEAPADKLFGAYWSQKVQLMVAAVFVDFPKNKCNLIFCTKTSLISYGESNSSQGAAL